MSFESGVEQSIALRNVERQNSVADLAACRLSDEAADTTQAIGALLLSPSSLERRVDGCSERIDPAADRRDGLDDRDVAIFPAQTSA